MKIDGRCHCGYITYEAEIELEKALICHCTDCQTLSGSAFRVHAYTREAVGAGPKVYAIRVGSIRQRDQIAPNLQLWSRSAQPWVSHTGSLRRIEKQPQIDQTGKVSLT
jgi:hypothetical protein